jgi:hypothetical protein
MASTAAEAAKAAEQPAAAQEQQANGNGEQKTRHSEVGHKSLLKSDDLYQVPEYSPTPELALWIVFFLLVCWV